MSNKLIKIAGAGISGLTAAINLAKAGYQVVVYEANDTSGKRFLGDLQGIENWSFEQDALEFLKEINIETNFNFRLFRKVAIWASNDYRKEFNFRRPIYYLLKRGSEEGCLDYGLQQQALKNKNIKIIYNYKAKPDEVDIVATGPVFNDPPADCFASGYTFKTDLKDCCIWIFDDEYAKDGYSYFLVFKNQAVLGTCIFNNFIKLNLFREKTLKFCKENINFSMTEMKKFSATGNFF